MKIALCFLLLLLSCINILWGQSGEKEFTDFGPLYQYINERIETTPEFDYLLQMGTKYFRSRDYVQAGEEFGKASILVPNHPLAQLYFSLCLFAIEKYQESSQILERAIYFYPSFSSLKLKVSELYYFSEDFETHFRTLKEFFRDNPQDEQAKFLVAFMFYYTQNTSQAKLLYKDLAKTKRYHSWANYFLRALGNSSKKEKNLLVEGQEFFRQNNFLAATDKFIEAHLAEPDQPFYVFQISLGLFALQKFEASAEFLKKGIALYNKWYELDLEATKSFSDAIYYQQRLDQLKNYLAQNSNNENLSLLFGFHLLFSGQSESAQTALKYASELKPEDVIIQQVLRHAHQVKVSPQKTDTPLQKEIILPKKENGIAKKEPILPPSNFVGDLDWGENEFRAGQYEQAVKICVLTSQRYPQNSVIKYQFALTLFATQRFEHAGKALEGYLTLKPKELPVWQNYYGNPEDYQTHFQKLEQTLESQITDLNLQLIYSILLIQEGNAKKARPQLYKLLDSHPNTVAIQTALQLAK